MKRWLLPLMLSLAVQQVHAQTKSAPYSQQIKELDALNVKARKDLDALDTLAYSPFSKNMVTKRVFSKLIYQDQQAIGGNIIREGRSVGTSATVEENAVTLNSSSPVLYKRFVVQVNLRGSSEDKFVSVFSDGDYQKTLSAGGTLLYFFPWNRSKYMERERLSLQRDLRSKRYKNEGQFDKLFKEAKDSIKNANKWDSASVPLNQLQWDSIQKKKIDQFIIARDNFLVKGLKNDSAWIDRFYENKLTKEDESKTTAKDTYIAYLEAEQAIKSILSSKWPAWKKKKEDRFIKDSLMGEGRDRYLQLRFRQATYQKYHSSLATYDTVQLKSPWSHRYRTWLSFKAGYNNAKQPLFDSSKPDKAYKKTYNDEYGEFLLAINHLAIHTKSKNYVSVGLGVSNMLDFKKEDQKTYQVTTQQPDGAGFIEVVKQSTVYPTLPKEVTFQTVQVQFATYWTKTIGFDLSYKGKIAKDYTDKNSASLGVFFPISTGETTLLFMPQLKWSDADEPKPWSFGFNLSASIPGFVTKDKK